MPPVVPHLSWLPDVTPPVRTINTSGRLPQRQMPALPGLKTDMALCLQRGSQERCLRRVTQPWGLGVVWQQDPAIQKGWWVGVGCWLSGKGP